MMDFIQDVEYQLELNLHSRTMLALRYGIAEESDQITGFFVRYPKDKKVKSEFLNEKAKRRQCTFNLYGQTVDTIIEGYRVITVLPRLASLKTNDAKAIATGFDFAIAIEPDILTMNEIVDWRDEYLSANGAINKDSLRRFLKSKSKRPDYRSPMEILGLPENFLDEVRELRQNWMDIKVAFNHLDIDCSDFEDRRFFREILSSHERVSKLAKSPQTLLEEETFEYLEKQIIDRQSILAVNLTDEDREFIEEHRKLWLPRLIEGQLSQNKWDEFVLTDDYKKLSSKEKDDALHEHIEFMERNHEIYQDDLRYFQKRTKEWQDFLKSSDYLRLSQDLKDLRHKQEEEFMERFCFFWVQSDEDRKNVVPINVAKRVKPEAILGVPSGGEVRTNYRGRPVFFHGDCIVTDIKVSKWNDGWHEIHYENETNRFITTTRQKWIIETYSVGQVGIWTVHWKDNIYYLQQFMGSDDDPTNFRNSIEWNELRYECFKRSGGKCEACGSKTNLEVDHIKPRSLYPHLELDLDNLQVLCQRCNKAKNNTDITNFRDS